MECEEWSEEWSVGVECEEWEVWERSVRGVGNVGEECVKSGMYSSVL